MADFPEKGRSGGSDAAAAFGGFLVVLIYLGIVVAWVFGLVSMVHGVWTKDLWETISGVVTIIILLIIRNIGR